MPEMVSRPTVELLSSRETPARKERRMRAVKPGELGRREAGLLEDVGERPPGEHVCDAVERADRAP